MSDSSEDEDLSRFKEVVDTSFINLIQKTSNNISQSVESACIYHHKSTDATPLWTDVLCYSVIILSPGTQRLKLKPHSERYIEEATHYNDVRVSDEMQKRIGTKVSEIINKNIKFINVQDNGTKEQKVEGGVKLFRDSTGFLSCEDVPDDLTKQHNESSKKIKRRRHHINNEDEMDEEAKINSVALSGDHILSQEDTKCWKSRRKEKIFKYKVKSSNVLIAVE